MHAAFEAISKQWRSEIPEDSLAQLYG